MQSSPTSRSPFRSRTNLAALAVCALAGCGGDDDCGPDGAPDASLVAAGDGLALTFGEMSAGLNNDCPAADAPAGVTSLTVHGTQVDGDGFITLCIERPDLIGDRAQALGPRLGAAEVHVVDVSGAANNCTYALDTAQAPTGTASASGVCGDGADPAGFALVLDGALSLVRTCGTATSSVAFTLRGRIAVAAD